MNALEIKKTILEIGKAKVTFNERTRDFLLNGKNPRELPIDYYSKLYLEFEKLLVVQLKEKCSEALLKTYIDYAKKQHKNLSYLRGQHRVSFVFRRSKGELSATAEYTHKDIDVRISTQIATLNNIIEKLLENIEFVDYPTSQDYRNEVISKDTSSTNLIPFESIGKATFKLNKKEALTLIYVMEKANLIEFENETFRNKFIENNFNYTENRKNPLQGTIIAMKDVNSDMSNLKSRDKYQVRTNNKSLERLKDKINETLSDFIFEEKPKKE